MSRADVLAVMDRLCILATDKGAGGHEAREARAAVAEMIQREQAAQQVFDCILRGINDGNVAQFGAGWLSSWAKSLLAAGFKPTNPDASDIRAALARCGGVK